MRFPSKFINYKDSLLYKFPFVLEQLEKNDMPLLTLYTKIKGEFKNISEYIEEMNYQILSGNFIYYFYYKN